MPAARRPPAPRGGGRARRLRRISASDHLQPWWEPGESGHAWVWLGAAGQATERIPLGTGVTASGARYHPALIAQAWMTLERLFPGRPFLGIGSGEALNEVPVSGDWPSPADQIERLDEALGLIRRLWDGATITEDGRFYRLKDCKLYTLADRRPPIWVSAFGTQAAEVAGRRGDGLWTLPDPGSDPEAIAEQLRDLEQLGGTVMTLQNNSAANAERAIEVLGREVVPALRGSRV
jgi:coenzyme F420-dependent glucose-6-phosphate dehydrogenase